MARGWGSKSIEIQIEEANSGSRADVRGRLPALEIEKLREREDLLLRRCRVLKDLPVNAGGKADPP